MSRRGKETEFCLALGPEGWYNVKVFSHFVSMCNGLLWGIPGVAMILGVGAFLTLSTRFVQIRLFPRALREFVRRLTHSEDSGGVTPFRALCTALAATVGTGNIAGVAGAIAIGGPGAVFWMWVSAFVGMATKYAESTLAVRYRARGENGEFLGGTMYMIRTALGEKWQFLAAAYAFFGLFAAFGVGNATQVNAVISALEASASASGFRLPKEVCLTVGLVLAVVVMRMVSGGAGRIGRTAELLVPLVSGAYILLCLAAILLRADRLVPALGAIVRGAFSPKAVTGGAVGSVFVCLRTGISRGVFTNEAGMGTAAMAHGSAEAAHPAQQGLMGIMEVFLDTIVICTLTALVILTSGVEIPYGTPVGAELTLEALCSVFGPWVGVFLSVCLCCFALATILGWGLYAGRCAQFLLGTIRWPVFAACQGVAVLLGAVLETGTVWSLSELMNGLMALPNLITLLVLSPELTRLTREYS